MVTDTGGSSGRRRRTVRKVDSGEAKRRFDVRVGSQRVTY